MKKALAVLLIVAAFLLLAPGAFGWLAQRDADARINRALDQVSFITLAEHRYHRGWFNSDETITVELFKGLPLAAAAAAPGGETMKPLRITVHNSIHHGPFPAFSGIGIARIDSEFVPPAGSKPAAATTALGSLSIQTSLGFLGGATTEVRHAAIPATDVGEGWHAAADALDFTFREGRHADSMDVEGKAPHMLLTHDDGSRIEITGLQASVHSTRALRSLYVGNSEFVLGEFDARLPNAASRQQNAAAAPDPNDPSAAGAGAGDFTLRALKANGHSEAVGGFLNGSGTITAMYAGVGAGHVQGLKIDGGVEHFQLDAFERLTDGLRKIQRDHPASPAEQAPAMQQLWNSAGVPLVTNDPAIVIRTLQFATAGGFATLSGSVRVHGATEADFKPAVNVGSLLKKLAVDFDVAVDQPLLERLANPKPPAGAPAAKPTGPSQLQALLAQGYLIDDHGRLRTKIVFADGKLTLNDKPFTPGRAAVPAAAGHP
jgi:uncharacterized protein YdgA (DUF945 family)